MVMVACVHTSLSMGVLMFTGPWLVSPPPTSGFWQSKPLEGAAVYRSHGEGERETGCPVRKEQG